MYAVDKNKAIKQRKLDEGWFHVRGGGRRSHYFRRGNHTTMCGKKIHPTDMINLLHNEIILYKIDEIFDAWVCRSCLRVINSNVIGLKKQ